MASLIIVLLLCFANQTNAYYGMMGLYGGLYGMMGLYGLGGLYGLSGLYCGLGSLLSEPVTTVTTPAATPLATTPVAATPVATAAVFGLIPF